MVFNYLRTCTCLWQYLRLYFFLVILCPYACRVWEYKFSIFLHCFFLNILHRTLLFSFRFSRATWFYFIHILLSKGRGVIVDKGCSSQIIKLPTSGAVVSNVYFNFSTIFLYLFYQLVVFSLIAWIFLSCVQWHHFVCGCF